MKRRSKRERSILATGEFARLAHALESNNFALAAEARRELSRLGYRVEATVGPAIDPESHLRPFRAEEEVTHP